MAFFSIIFRFYACCVLPLALHVSISQRSEAATIDVDPEAQNLWWLHSLGVYDAWTVATGQGVTLAICDSGYRLGERDLAPNFLTDLAYDFADRDDSRNVQDGPFLFHGTANAAIVAAVKDGLGTQGIAHQAKVIPLQNYNYDTRLDDIAKDTATEDCIRHASLLAQVDIILVLGHADFGSVESVPRIRDAVREAIARDVTVVVSAGHQANELSIEAADDTGSIIVGGLLKSGQTAGFSNFGNRISVSAFAEKIWTLQGPNGRMDYIGGVPVAASQVAGVVALMLSVNPDLKPHEIRRILEETRVEELGNTAVGGRLDAAGAVRTAIESLRNIKKLSNF